MASHPQISTQEFEQIEKLLGGLLIEATDDEVEKILHIHHCVKSLYHAQSKENDTLDHLRKIAC